MNIDKKKFFQMIVDTGGNPSVKDFMSCGYSEGMAVEHVIRMSQNNSDVYVRVAKEFLKNN